MAKGDANVTWDHLRGAGLHIPLMQLGERFLTMGEPAVAPPALERAPQIRSGYAPAVRALAEARRRLSARLGEEAVASGKAAAGGR